MAPPDLIHFAFGPDSFAKHRAAAQAIGSNPEVVERPGLAFDLDSPADLADLPSESRHELGLEPLIERSASS